MSQSVVGDVTAEDPQASFIPPPPCPAGEGRGGLHLKLPNVDVDEVRRHAVLGGNGSVFRASIGGFTVALKVTWGCLFSPAKLRFSVGLQKSLTTPMSYLGGSVAIREYLKPEVSSQPISCFWQTSKVWPGWPRLDGNVFCTNCRKSCGKNVSRKAKKMSF